MLAVVAGYMACRKDSWSIVKKIKNKRSKYHIFMVLILGFKG